VNGKHTTWRTVEQKLEIAENSFFGSHIKLSPFSVGKRPTLTIILTTQPGATSRLSVVLLLVYTLKG
jgi:hypothetical protein